MNAEWIVDELVESGVLETVEGGDELKLTSKFRDAIDNNHTELEAMDRDSLYRASEAAALSDGNVGGFLEVFRDNIEIFAEYHAVRQFVDSISQEEMLQLIPVLDRFRKTSPPTDGVPDGFLPVHGDKVSSLVKLHSGAVVYVWRDECEPCDTVKRDFEILLDTPPDTVALYAVYGPDWSEQLEDDFDVVGAPTVLITLDGSVDARLQGPHARSTLEAEIELIEERVDRTAVK